jgi:hypothetical protein
MMLGIKWTITMANHAIAPVSRIAWVSPRAASITDTEYVIDGGPVPTA